MEALFVSLELEFFIKLSSVKSTGGIDLNGVVNNQIDWAERVDLLGITTKALHGVTHGSEVDNSGNTTKLKC